MSEEVKDQEVKRVVVTPEILLGQIAGCVGEEFVVIPTDGWMKIVDTIHNFKEADGVLLEILEELSIPVVPVSLAKKEEKEEPLIIMPNDVPQGDSNIIMPNNNS